jgi:hypothetical protein
VSEREKSDSALYRTDDRIALERRLIGALIYFSAGHRPYLPRDVVNICPPECFIGPGKYAMLAIQTLVSEQQQVDLVSVVATMARLQTPGRPAQYAVDTSVWSSEAADLITESSVLDAAEMICAEYRKDLAMQHVLSAERSLKTFGVPYDTALEDILRAQEVLNDDILGTRKIDFDTRLDEYSESLDSGNRVRPVATP